MSGHFSAYSFVDRITELQPGKRAEAEFLVPGHIARFPRTLVAEAAGQLAAWNAMACLEYKVRPVAGLAAEIRFGPEVWPGQRLDIAVAIESCELDAVSYSAWVDADGVRVLELDHCVGPMLPMEEFDSPDAVRERFELLCGPGAPSGRFEGVPEPDVKVVERVSEQRVVGTLQVPKEAPFFADHFPRRAVYPGTLLLDAHIGLLLKFAAESKRWPPDTRFAPIRILDLKMRSFTLPGEVLELWIDVDSPAEPTKSTARTSVRKNGKPIAGGGIEITAMSGN
jgi:3-hydroxymyristoyl/3-hydroxydecanoyl-(acyl carrier protein) dehydratase